MDGWMEGWIDGWMDEWMDGWMDGWMNKELHGWTLIHSKLKMRKTKS